MRSLRAIIAGVEYKHLVAAAFVFGLFMDILDTTIVNVALPVLGEDFNAGTAQLEWVVTGYLLSLAIWIPASGWIGDRFGTKRTFLFATAMFVVGSALCAAAWSIQSLAFFRVLQGVGGGMLTPVGTAMLYRAFTPAERARASAIMSIPTMIAPMLGPVIGGFLVTYVSWRWIFLVSMQTAAFAAIPRDKTGRASSLFSTVRQVGAALGVAVAATVLSSWTSGSNSLDLTAHQIAGLQGFHYAVAALLVMGGFSLFFALRVRAPDAAPLPVVSRLTSPGARTDAQPLPVRR